VDDPARLGEDRSRADHITWLQTLTQGARLAVRSALRACVATVGRAVCRTGGSARAAWPQAELHALGSPARAVVTAR
jgi:hypothetical protein